MFKKLFGSSKIRVELIEALSNQSFGSVKLPTGQLPASFDKPTTLTIEGEDWRVEKAEPMSSEEFIKTGELTLWLTKVLTIDPRNIRYSIPTISNDLPPTSTDRTFHEFEVAIHEDDWRQLEFLPKVTLPQVQEEMNLIEDILFPENDHSFDSLNGFDRVHVRKIGRKQLSIPLGEFLDLTPIQQKGSLVLHGYGGYVENGFVFKNANHSYYGTIEKDFIIELCLQEFDSMDEEINHLISKYQLLFVCWCRGMISAG